MDKAARNKLKQFLEEHIPFYDLKKVGFFDKSIRKTDYEKIAARVCLFFGYKNIYQYKGIKTMNALISNHVPGDKTGLDSTAEWITPTVDVNDPMNWPDLQVVEQTELISQDKFLN